MEQWNAIRTLVQTLQGDTAVRSIFLKGSLARGDGDEYSDVDVYCLVHDHELESFLDRRLDHLRHYRDLLFWSEANFVGPQIVAVYSNGLHLDLNTVTASTLHTTDAVKILYDPEGLLAGYEGSSFTLSKENILKAFDSLTFSLLEFESTFRRGNLVWASRLASHISGELVLLVRHVYDPSNGQLGFKKINQTIPEAVYQALSDGLDGISPANLPDGLCALLDLVEETISKLPDDITSAMNMRFYSFMAERIRVLERSKIH